MLRSSNNHYKNPRKGIFIFDIIRDNNHKIKKINLIHSNIFFKSIFTNQIEFKKHFFPLLKEVAQSLDATDNTEFRAMELFNQEVYLVIINKMSFKEYLVTIELALELPYIKEEQLNIDNLLLILDQKLAIKAFQQNNLTFLNLTKDIIDKHIGEVFNFEDTDLLYSNLEKSLETNILPFQLNLILSENNIIYMEARISIINNLNDTVAYYFLILKNRNSKIDEIGFSLCQSNKQFESLMQASKCVFWEINKKGKFLYVSDKSLDLWGLTPSEILKSHTFYDIHPKESVESPKLQVIKNFNNKEDEIAFECPISSIENKIWVFCYVLPIYNTDKKLIGYRGCDFDITESKLITDSLNQYSKELENAIYDLRISKEQVEESLYRQNILLEEITITKEKLEQSNAEKDKFFSIIAHDLRSPFSGFLDLTKMLNDNIDVLEREEVRDLAIMLTNSANNTYKLLENLLEWSRLKQNAISFMPDSFDLKLLINNILQLQHQNINKKNITIIDKIPENFIMFADANMINIVIRNLVSNAIKFTSRNGRIELFCQKTDKEVFFSIKDTGIGIPNHILENLFKVGAKTSRLGTEGEASTGLGIFLCKEYIEKHNGEFNVKSEEGFGSEFYFTLTNQKSELK